MPFFNFLPMYHLIKRILFYLTFSLGFVSFVSAQPQTGIRFFQGSWNELLSEASARHLPVFVDVYTDWCGPCKRMEQEVFILPEVSKFYNESFLCYRLNAEKGEGPSLAKAYGINAYPTWLFLNGDGTLRNRRTDYLPAADFISVGITALGKDSFSVELATLDRRYKAGERDPVFLQNYLTIRTEGQLDNATVMNAYIVSRKKSRPDARELWFMVKNSGRTWSSAVALVGANLPLLSLLERKQLAMEYFDKTIYFAWGDAVKENNAELANEIMSTAEKFYPFLDEAKKLNYDHAALYHCRKLKQVVCLKKAAYRLAIKQMAVDIGVARQKDQELYAKVKHFYEQAPKDAVQLKAFEEEKEMAMKQYSGKTAGLLYESAEAFVEVLPPADPALKDARKWADKAYILTPNPAIKKLMERLNQL